MQRPWMYFLFFFGLILVLAGVWSLKSGIFRPTGSDESSAIRVENDAQKGKAQIFYRGRLAAELPNAWGEYQARLIRQTPHSAYFEHCLKETPGYLLFGVCPRRIYRLDLDTLAFTNVLGANPNPVDLAEDVSPNEKRLVVGRNDIADGDSELQVVLMDMFGGNERILKAPAGYTQLGDAHFSPDGKQVGYAVAMGDPDREEGAIIVADLTSGIQSIAASTTQMGTYMRFYGWKAGSLDYRVTRFGSPATTETGAARWPERSSQ